MYSPDGMHEVLIRRHPSMAFDETKDFAAQQKAIREKLIELLGERPQPVPLNPVVEETTEHETFTEYRISFDAEEKVKAVCILCIPKLNKEKYPLVICVQGHGTGMHVSMGRKLYDSDDPGSGDRDNALQALERGYAALCLEQRGMGERRTIKQKNLDDAGHPRCQVTAMNALLVGRTLLGERCFDISRAIDLALTYPQIDGSRILLTGNSGGGTATYYASCLDERITVSMPSCAVCTFKDSLGFIKHCTCNFVPNLGKYLDMGDMAAAIAPRPLIVINGSQDNIFPKHGVDEAFATIQKIYTAAGVPDMCINATGEGGHRYYKQEAWEAFDKLVHWD